MKEEKEKERLRQVEQARVTRELALMTKEDTPALDIAEIEALR